MAIVKPCDMDFSTKNIVMVLSGLPGTGKTTLALSAPDVLLIDTDEGMCRVNKAHRRDASICKTYEDILADVESAKGSYKTIVIDTAGALIDYMKEWAMRTEPSQATKKNGGFALAGYGIIKSEFIRWVSDIRKWFNVIFIFHEQMTKNNEALFYDLVCEGSAKVIVYQPADLAAHLFIQGGERILGFTPTEEYTAKSAYGISGLMKVPALNEGDANDFLTKLFAQIRANLKKEAAAKDALQKEYDEVMKYNLDSIASATKPEHIKALSDAIKGKDFKDVLTARDELKAALKKRSEELGIIWDPKIKNFRFADEGTSNG